MLNELLQTLPAGEPVIVVTQDDGWEPADADGRVVTKRIVEARDLSPGDRLPLDAHFSVVLEAIEQEYLKGEVSIDQTVWVVVDGSGLTTTLRGTVGGFLLPPLDRAASSKLPEWLQIDVLRDVLMIMLQLRAIPKHRRVGSMLIVGDPAVVRPLAVECEYVKFDTLEPAHRRVGHPAAKELIRKLASVDHVYLVDPEGNLVSLLEYIFPPGGPRALGLGSRHTSAAALSANCDVVVFTVQGSTGKIRAYRGGEVALQI